MTTRAERHSSPRWPVAWFLSLCSPWRRVVKRNREREGRMTPLPLPAPTLTCWHDAFSILVCTVPRDSSSRIWMPLHPPKYIGMMCSLFTVRLFFWEGLMFIMTPQSIIFGLRLEGVFLGCFSFLAFFLVVLSCWGGRCGSGARVEHVVYQSEGSSAHAVHMLKCRWARTPNYPRWIGHCVRVFVKVKRCLCMNVCVKVACSKKPFKGWAGVKKRHQVPVHLLFIPVLPQAQASIIWFQRGDERRRFGDAPAHQKASASEEENQTVWRAVWEGEKLQGKIRTLMFFLGNNKKRRRRKKLQEPVNYCFFRLL